MEKILILDLYPNTDFRISKDTSGGYGTGNNFGNKKIIPKILKYLLKKNSDWPPLFAAYTYACLKKRKFDVKFLNNIPENICNYDLIIFTSSIVVCNYEKEKLSHLSKLGIPIFVIGPFASNNPKYYKFENVTIVKGQPEYYFLKADFKNDINKNITNEFSLDNLDELPFIEWSDISKINKINNLFGYGKSLPILATRGCPYSCFKYCVYPLQQGRKVNQRSVENIVSEIEYNIHKNKIKTFIFRDPVFSINRNHTIEFCKLVIEKKLNFKFVIETHLRILDTELLNWLKKSGLVGVKVGIENFDTEILKKEGRFTVSRDDQLEKINEIKSKNIAISAMYIIGFPSDTIKSIRNTLNYAIKLNTTYAQFSVYTPYPSTPIFKNFEDKIFSKTFENFTQYDLVYKHDNLDKQTVKSFLEKCYLNYYFRFNWLTNYIVRYFSLTR
jgi:radical SAM superfamily enzyme YgiQ (UPF0313 family)